MDDLSDGKRIFDVPFRTEKGGALSSRPKTPEIWEPERMVQKLPGTVSRKSGKCRISEMRAIHLEISKIKFQEQNRMELEIIGKKIRKFGSTLRGCPLFRKFWKNRHAVFNPSSFVRESIDLGMLKQLNMPGIVPSGFSWLFLFVVSQKAAKKCNKI